MKKYLFVIFLAFVLSIFLYFHFKGRENIKINSKNIVAVVGSTVITKDMLNRELLFYQNLNPDFKITKETKAKVLNNLINKYILIEEAKREKLDTSPEFIDKIRNYWEETLIQLLYKNIQKKIEVVVSEEELKNFYQIKGKKIEGYVGSYYTEQEAKNALKVFPDKKAVKYFDINNSNLPLELKFKIKNFKEGETSSILTIGDKFYIVKVTKVEKKDIPPFEKIRPLLKNELTQIKREKKFNNWLNSLKKKTNVKVYYSNME